jgi:formiminotetrahydrofolate cyclodeaminase
MGASPGEHGPTDAASHPVGVFLAELASASPAPGGGAAAALAGALAAALVAMVARVTIARDASVAAMMEETVTGADRLRDTLTRLVTEDADAYRRLVQSQATPPGSSTRVDALRSATAVPLSISRHSREVLALCEAVAPRARASTVSDLGVAVALAWAALDSGASTVRANLKSVTDAEFREASEREVRTLLSDGEQARGRVSRMVAERIG